METVLAMPEEESATESSDGSSPGLIAGAVVGSLSGVGALGLFAFWFLRNRRRDGDGGKGSAGLESVGAGKMPRRNTSLLSRVGILRSEKSYPGGNAMGTMHSGSGGFGGVEDGSSLTPVSERRSSRPFIFDQRMNPYALMEYDNGDQVSIATMADDRDYTRPLNVSIIYIIPWKCKCFERLMMFAKRFEIQTHQGEYRRQRIVPEQAKLSVLSFCLSSSSTPTLAIRELS